MQGAARRLTLDTVIYGIGGSAARAVSILFIPVFTRIFSSAEYGALDVLITFNALLSMVAMAGMNSAIFFHYRRTDDVGERARLTGTAATVVLATSASLAVIGVMLARPIAELVLRDADYTAAVVASAVLVPANVTAWAATDLLRLEFRPIAYSVLGIGRTLLGSVVGVGLVIVADLGVEGLIASQAAFAAAAAGLAFWLSRHTWTPSFDPQVARRMLLYGAPLVPAGLAYWVMGYSDRFVLIQFHGLAAVGVYAMANKVSQLVELVVTSFQSAWWPFAYAQAREPGHERLFATVFRTYVVGIAWIAVALGLFAREALVIATTPEFVPAYAYVGLLAFALVVNACYQVFSVGVALAAKTWHLAWTSGVAAGLNLALNFALIPPLAILGAALATLISYSVSAALVYVVAGRHYPIPYDFRAPALMAAGCGVALAGGAWLDSTLALTELSLPVMAAKAVMLVALLGLAWRLPGISARQTLDRLRGAPRAVPEDTA